MACRNAGRCSVFSLALQGTESNCAGKFWRFDGEAACPLRLLASLASTSPKVRGLGSTVKFPVLPRAPPLRRDFPRPGEDVTAGDKKGNLTREAWLRGRERYPNIRQTPPSGGLAAFAAILNKRFSPENRDQFFFSTGTIQPLVSGSLPHCIPVMVSYSFWVTGPILPSPM